MIFDVVGLYSETSHFQNYLLGKGYICVLVLNAGFDFIHLMNQKLCGLNQLIKNNTVRHPYVITKYRTLVTI